MYHQTFVCIKKHNQTHTADTQHNMQTYNPNIHAFSKSMNKSHHSVAKITNKLLPPLLCTAIFDRAFIGGPDWRMVEPHT